MCAVFTPVPNEARFSCGKALRPRQDGLSARALCEATFDDFIFLIELIIFISVVGTGLIFTFRNLFLQQATEINYG